MFQSSQEVWRVRLKRKARTGRGYIAKATSKIKWQNKSGKATATSTKPLMPVETGWYCHLHNSPLALGIKDWFKVLGWRLGLVARVKPNCTVVLEVTTLDCKTRSPYPPENKPGAHRDAQDPNKLGGRGKERKGKERGFGVTRSQRVLLSFSFSYTQVLSTWIK